MIDPQPGDFILTSSKSYVGAAIRFGQRLRFHGADLSYNHAAGVVAEGRLVEMLGGGATASSLSKYTDFALFKCPDPAKADVAVGYWLWCLENHVGYNWLAAASDGLTCLTGSKLQFGDKGRLICSGMVAAGYCYAGMPGSVQWVADPSHVFPCELGEAYAQRRQ